MTPLDKAREALAAVEKAKAGWWLALYEGEEVCVGDDETSICQMLCYSDGSHKANAAAIVSAVNFVRADLPALIAEVERAVAPVTPDMMIDAYNAGVYERHGGGKTVSFSQQSEAGKLTWAAVAEHLNAAMAAEHERLADRVAKLEGALEAIDDLFGDAVQADCENGVRCLNERAAASYLKEYPATADAITKALVVIRALLTPAKGTEDDA